MTHATRSNPVISRASTCGTRAIACERPSPDGSALFNQDATFCAQPGLSGSGASFQSFNYPEHYIRHFNSEVWIASDGGPGAWDSQVSYGDDATWNIVAPWGP